MKQMTNFIAVNYGYLLIAAIGLILLGYGLKNLKKPEVEKPTTKSIDFSEDSVVSNPVATHPWVNVFKDAADAAIYDQINPWDYLKTNWAKIQNFKGSVEKAMLDFITNEAHQKIPDSAKVSLSIREYSNPNSIVMEYRDPAKDSVMVTTGHDPEPCLYATFANKKGESKTYKLICANGLVRELGEGEITAFEEDYEIKFGDSFIGITGSTPGQAAKFAEENNLSVRFVLEGLVTSKTPDFSKAKVYKDFSTGKKGVFDVIIQPGDILRKKNGKWLYIKTE